MYLYFKYMLLSLLWKFQMENTKCDLGTHPNTNVNSFEYFPNRSNFYFRDLPKLTDNQPTSTLCSLQSRQTFAIDGDEWSLEEHLSLC